MVKQAGAPGRNSVRAKLGAARRGTGVSAFDYIHARPHHDVLGRHVKGLAVNAAVSRARGVENRKRTLAVQLAREGRASSFVDERFGEQAAGMSLEDKMLGRYKLAKKAKVSSRAARYALDDGDADGGAADGGAGLTHMGEALGEHNMGTWDAPSDDENEEAELGMGSARYVRELNFGGGDGDGAGGGAGVDGERVKSRAEVMAEVIAKSKFYRAERHRAKLEQVQTIAELDAQFDDIRALLTRHAPAAPSAAAAAATAPAVAAAAALAAQPAQRGEDEHVPAAAPERADDARADKHADFDALSRELALASRARPADRLRTDAEKAEAEAERLARLEVERKARMRAELAAVGAGAADVGLGGGARAGARARTDDDLEVNFKLGDGDDDDGGGGNDGSGSDGEAEAAGEEGEEGEESGDDDDDDDDDADDDDDDDYDGARARAASEPLPASARRPPAREIGGGADGGAGRGREAQLKPGDTNDGAADAEQPQRSGERAPADRRVEDARIDLPFAPACPQTEAELDALLALARGSAESEHLLLNRVLACHHTSLSPTNKPALGMLCDLLLRRPAALCARGAFEVRSLDALCAPLHTLCHAVPMSAAERAKVLLGEMVAAADRRERALDKAARRGARDARRADADALARARACGAELLTLKLIANLFPTTDRRHAVCTAGALVLARAASCRAPLDRASDAMLAVGSCGLLLHYAAADGGARYAPEAHAGAARVGLALAHAFDACTPPAAGARACARRARVLLAHAASGWEDASRTSLVAGARENDGALDEAARLDCLLDCAAAWTALASDASRALADCACAPEAAGATRASAAQLCAALRRLGAQADSEARAVERARDALDACVRAAVSRRAPLALQRRAPVSLRTLEPDFDESGRAAALDRPISAVRPSMLPGASRDEMKAAARQMRETAALRAQHRRELKAAERELRKDAAFVAAERLSRRAQLDAELDKAQKRARAVLENQEANFKTMLHDRKKALMQKL